MLNYRRVRISLMTLDDDAHRSPTSDPRFSFAKAETGAGQHGVATAAACALLDLECAAWFGSGIGETTDWWGLIQQQCHGDCWLVDVGFLFAHLLQGAMVLECLFTYHMIISCWGRCWYPKMHRIAFSVHSFGGFWPIDHSVLTWNWLVASRWKAIGWITMGYCRFATSKTCWLVVSTITVIQLGFTKHGNM